MQTVTSMDIFWILFSASLVFLMQPGFMCLESGLTRSKNSINVAVKNLADFCFSVLGFWVAGYALMFGTTHFGWVGLSGYFFSFEQTPFAVSFFFFQVMFCGTATTIFSGAVAERMPFSSYLIVASFLSMLIYPVFGHWAWNGLETGTLTGWLGRRGFVDFAGSTVVHSVGGWVALAALLVIGPRTGRFPRHGPPREITAFNLPLSILGTMLLWFGWFGFNGGSTLALDARVPGIIARTTLAAGAGAATSLFTVWWRTGLPKVTALINGSLGGLVAITANCHCVHTAHAAIIGAIAGLVCVFMEAGLLRLRVDDAVGAVPVHLGCGIWGTLAVAFFGDGQMTGTGLGFWDQLAVQTEGILAAFVIAFLLPYLIIRDINRVWPMRVSVSEEKNGLNVSEHGVSTELHDLFEAMDHHAQTGDFSRRVPVEPFTEVGQIARRYNHVITALEQASSKVEAVFRSASEAIVTFATDTHRILQVNPSAWRMFGFSGQAAMAGLPLTRLFEVDDKNSRRDLIDNLFSHRLVEVKARHHSGHTFPVEGIITVSGMGKDSFYVGSFRDISSRKMAEAALAHQQRLFRELFDSSPLGILLVDPSDRVVDVNRAFTTLFGYAVDEIHGNPDMDRLVPDHLKQEAQTFLNTVMDGSTINRETVRKDKFGRMIHVSMVVYPIQVAGRAEGIYYIYSDITPRKTFETQLAHQAFHDALTGLPNRARFFERLNLAIQRQARNSQFSFAAMMLDMDRFKSINDTLGHQVGDRFLIEVARRIQGCIRSIDSVARLGGDEFGIVLEDYQHPREVITIAKRIIAEMKRPFVIEGNTIHSSASVGIVIKVREYDNTEAIMRDADIAMYRAKALGKSRFKVFGWKMHSKVLRENELECELHLAIDNDELVVFYQPIVAVTSGKIVGFEALVRWDNPRCGLISPAEFIPVAEESGQIVAIGRYVLREACRQMAAWKAVAATDREALSISVNVSARQFRQAELVRAVAETLAETGLDPCCLKLELTESSLMTDTRNATRVMADLKKMGVQIVIDDFGTGYSSLSYIQRFPIDGLKIDRSFISGHGQWENARIVQTIITLAKSIDVSVVAEGVEESDQLDMLRQAGCDFAQGYLFAKPLDARAAGRSLGRWGVTTDNDRSPSQGARRDAHAPAIHETHCPGDASWDTACCPAPVPQKRGL